ncbi:flagellar associated protein [Haematococcus lacustris]|uniref:Flagellar associated protein n=1 Tax=Haematococcus lacustris TaxID=44745 RepID=A0A6A0AB43_HAELA|nr:flagellar associated protein [Haematococcus lacustris]
MSSTKELLANYTAQNRVWEVDILPEKPNRTVPTQNPNGSAIQAATTLLQDLSSLKNTDKQPHERFALPVTANMEYGFFATQPLIPANPMFDHKHRSRMNEHGVL